LEELAVFPIMEAIGSDQEMEPSMVGNWAHPAGVLLAPTIAFSRMHNCFFAYAKILLARVF
jgi:hypothetical protein